MTWLLELVEKGDIWESFSWEGFPAAISPQGFKYISLQWLLQNSVKGWYLRKFQLIGFSCCHLSTFSRLRPVFPISSSKSWVGSSSSLESSFLKVAFSDAAASLKPRSVDPKYLNPKLFTHKNRGGVNWAQNICKEFNGTQIFQGSHLLRNVTNGRSLYGGWVGGPYLFGVFWINRALVKT